MQHLQAEVQPVLVEMLEIDRRVHSLELGKSRLEIREVI